MERIDADMARRVWQRVAPNTREEAAAPREARAPIEAGGEAAALCALAAQELSDAAAYEALGRMLGGQKALLAIAREERAHAACLRGMCRLYGAEPPALRALPPTEGAVRALLCRRCAREWACIEEYTRRADGRFGPVFARLAAQERAHAQTVLELLGA